MTQLPYVWPLIGGLLIGLSAAIYLLFNGRVAGISGMVARSAGLSGRGIDPASLVFLLGVIGGAGLASLLLREPRIILAGSAFTLLGAGVLIGFGTRLGSGCTSGHGVCGVARLSRRSITATAIFMAVAMVTVYINRHVLGGL